MTESRSQEIWEQASDRIRSLKSAHRLRHAEAGCPAEDNHDTGAYRTIDGKKYVNFCSNDYLDLAHHPRVKDAAKAAVDRYGAGATASRLVCGDLPLHEELESAIAEFKKVESALVFSSGYMACLGAVQALSLRADESRVPILFDRLSHASLVDAATQDRRNWRSFPHNDIDSLETLLKRHAGPVWPAALVVTEGIFSMDGDLAPLRAISDLCEKYRAILLVDDAHGTGILGPKGEGTVTQLGLSDCPHIVQVGTLSKALGSQGGFVAGPKVVRELMVNTARTFIFDTGLNPAAAAAALEAINVIRDEPERREKFKNNVMLFRRLLKRVGCNTASPTPIIPVILGDEMRSIKTSHQMREEGFLVAAIRPPTVAPGTSRLRITITSAHTEDDLRKLAHAVGQLDTR